MEASTSPTIDKQLIGRTIRSHRESKNLIQEQVASRFGWNKQVISDLESGKAVSLEKVMAVSKFFDISLDDLRGIALL
jgi:transcriptional regulator with XRE-family HTH domain